MPSELAVAWKLRSRWPVGVAHGRPIRDRVHRTPKFDIDRPNIIPKGCSTYDNRSSLMPESSSSVTVAFFRSEMSLPLRSAMTSAFRISVQSRAGARAPFIMTCCSGILSIPGTFSSSGNQAHTTEQSRTGAFGLMLDQHHGVPKSHLQNLTANLTVQPANVSHRYFCLCRSGRLGGTRRAMGLILSGDRLPCLTASRRWKSWFWTSKASTICMDYTS